MSHGDDVRDQTSALKEWFDRVIPRLPVASNTNSQCTILRETVAPKIVPFGQEVSQCIMMCMDTLTSTIIKFLALVLATTVSNGRICSAIK
jgi:hypothetical protein